MNHDAIKILAAKGKKEQEACRARVCMQCTAPGSSFVVYQIDGNGKWEEVLKSHMCISTKICRFQLGVRNSPAYPPQAFTGWRSGASRGRSSMSANVMAGQETQASLGITACGRNNVDAEELLALETMQITSS